jgi:DNA-binding NtrC family response regulator
MRCAGARLAPPTPSMSKSPPIPNGTTGTSPSVVILSADPTAAALLGALVETLGYPVSFARPAEAVEDTLRRARPRICLVDCGEPDAERCREDVLARAVMRGICVVLYADRKTIVRFRELARRLDLETLLMPTDGATLEETLRRALERRVGA